MVEIREQLPRGKLIAEWQMATVMIMIIITQVDFHHWSMGVENRHILPKAIYVLHCVFGQWMWGQLQTLDN